MTHSLCLETTGKSETMIKLQEIFRYVTGYEDFESRNPALDKIDELAKTCCVGHWDGGEALPITQKVHEHARGLLKDLQVGIAELPEVVPSPDGAIVFEWYRNPSQTMAININPDGNFYWSAIIDDQGYNGFARYRRNVSKILKYYVKQIIG